MGTRTAGGQSAILVAPDIQDAIRTGAPVVALESAVITHGLPYPNSLAIARRMEAAVQDAGAMPATVAVFEGCIRVGLQTLN
jgi:pseudouridine-5'-phosphate glycosidase